MQNEYQKLNSFYYRMLFEVLFYKFLRICKYLKIKVKLLFIDKVNGFLWDTNILDLFNYPSY
jgi:hypothetical protein